MRFIVVGQVRPYRCALGLHAWGPNRWVQAKRRWTRRCEREGCRAVLTWTLERY